MLKNILFFFVAALAAASAQQQGKVPARKATATTKETPAADTSKAPAATSVRPYGIKVPANAVLIAPGRWKHTDEKGKVWMYRDSPFGIVKYEPEPENTPPPVDTGMTVADEGDSVRFSRITPFGVRNWTRKKSELEGDELSTWNRFLETKSKAVSAAPAGNAKSEGGK
jgi:hypothetical protein